MVGSTSYSSNIHGFADDNNNPYKSMVIDTIRMNHGYSSEESCNILFILKTKSRYNQVLKTFEDLDKPLQDECITQYKLFAITRVFIIKSGYGLSEARYNSIIK